MEMPCVSAAGIWLDETDKAENVSLPMDNAICLKCLLCRPTAMQGQNTVSAHM